MTKKRVAIIAVAAALLIGLGIFLTVAVRFVLHRSTTPRVYNTVTIIQQVQGLSQLVTVKYVLEKVVILEDPKYVGVFPLGDNRIVLLAHGIVKAGVDLSQLKDDDLKISGTKISVNLPKATLTDAYLVDKDTQVIDFKTGLLRTFDKDLEKTARLQALTDIQRTARQGDILKEADERARLQLTNLLRLLGFTDVEVRTRK